MKKQSRSSLLTLVLLPLFGILCVCFSMDRVPAAVLSLLTVAAAALSLRTRTYTLSNGKQITQPASRALLIAVVLVDVVLASGRLTGFDLSIIAKRGGQFFVILDRIFHPDFSYFEKVVNPLMVFESFLTECTPQMLRDYADLGDDIVVIGVGTRAEIWNRTTWEEYLADKEQNYADIADDVLPEVGF